ncbi:MAG: flotillin domain-containing protein [Burkholderiaceae bacterium]
MAFLTTLFGIIVAIIVAALVIAFLNRFYRKSSRDVALIRTGYGGQQIILSGGCLAVPFLHKVEEVNMRTIRVDVRRIGNDSLITEDRMRVDVELEFYVRVQPNESGVATAAQAIGAKALNPDAIRNLLEGRFVNAIQAVAAASTMDTLHERRAEFIEQVSGLLREDLASNGLLLSSVSLTHLDQTPFGSLDENNAFNAVGMRRLAEIIAVNKKKRAEIEADADISVRRTRLEATKQRLSLSREEESEQIAQQLEIEKVKAASDAETAQARENAMVASEQARIKRERETRLAEVEKQRELRRIEIEAQLNSEIRKVESAITLAGKQAEEAKALAEAETARTQIVLAKEHVQTERERVVAARSLEIALKRVEEAGEVARSNAASDAEVLLKQAKAETEAVRMRGEAERLRLLAESEGMRAQIEAENARSGELVHMKLEQYRLDKLPDIVGQLIKPAEKIDSIRIHQINGFGHSTAPGGSAGDGAGGGDRPPVNQVMDSILGMALQLPALRSIGDSIGVDFSAATVPGHAGGLGSPASASGTKPSARSPGGEG